MCQSTAGEGACDVCSGRAGASEDDDVPGDELIALVEQEALVEVDVRMAKSVRLSQDRVGMRGSELSEGAPAKGAEGDERPEHARW